MNKVMFLARRFVAGTTAEEAVPVVEELNGQGIRATMTVLGENVTLRKEALGAVEDGVRLLDLIQDRGLDASVSIKLTRLGLDIDEEFCLENLEQIVEKARATGNFVRIDMEGPKHTQRILDVFRRIQAVHENVGIVIQSMLFRSDRDIPELLSRGARIRLCKGAYKVPAALAHKTRRDIARAFTGHLETLLASGGYHGVATHDESLIRWTLDHVKEKGLDPESFEFQMLYGMRRNRQIALAEAGYNVRCYVPFGSHWFSYYYRRLRERKENVFFLLRNLFTNS